jgi:hypothetical protein
MKTHKKNIFYYNIFLIIFFCNMLLLALPSNAQPPGRILFNSDFEIPTLTPASPSPPRQSCNPATSCWYLVPENDVPGWNVVDNPAAPLAPNVVNNLVEFWNSGFTSGVTVPAQSGNQFIELNAAQETPVYFEICMFAGETLTWSLWHRGRSGTDQMFLNITDANGAALAAQTFSTGNTAWVNYTGMVTNTGPNGAVRFTFRPGTTASGSATVGNFIDNIQVLGLRPLVEFANPTYSAGEALTSAPRLLINGTIPVGGVTVTIGITGGSATAGTDFSFTPNVTIPAGNYDGTVATSIPINMAVLEDLLAEGNETINFRIVSAGNPLLVNDANCNGGIQDATVYTIIDNDLPLPVELVTFTAKNIANKVELTWQTSSEKSSSYFEVQKSRDSENWTAIGRVMAVGNSNINNQYSFYDERTIGNMYYRLKMVDTDQSFKYSKIVSVSTDNIANKESSILIYPNPVNKGEKINIELNTANSAGKVLVELNDILGRQSASYLVEGNHISVDTPNIAGVYLMTIFDGNAVYRYKIVVQ